MSLVESQFANLCQGGLVLLKPLLIFFVLYRVPPSLLILFIDATAFSTAPVIPRGPREPQDTVC